MFKHINNTALVSLLLGSALLSQDASADERWRNTIEFKTKVDDTTYSIASDQRFLLDDMQWLQVNLKLGAVHQLDNGVKLGVELRTSDSRKSDGSHQDEQRITPSISQSFAAAGGKLSVKAKLQNGWKDGEHNFRPRLSTKYSYKVSDYSLYASYEYLYNETKSKTHSSRVKAGVKFDLVENLSLDAYLMELNNRGNSDDFVIGTKFSYRF